MAKPTPPSIPQRWTRRDVLKSGLAASAGALAAQLPAAALAAPLEEPTAAAPAPAAAALAERRQKLDLGWRFRLGNADVAADDLGFGRGQRTFAKALGAAPAARLDYDDSGWEAVELPHDWAVELPFHQDRQLVAHGSKPLGRDYPATSMGWYRNVFTLPAKAAGQRVGVEFDGVFRNAMVFFNGEYVGENFSGYAPFRFDLTDLAAMGGRNALTVRVDATLGEGWFYEGAGLYRHVWLTRTQPLHFAADATAVRSELGEGHRQATVRVTTTARNDRATAARCRLRLALFDAQGRGVGAAHSPLVEVAAWGEAELAANALVAAPVLWSLRAPHLYRAVLALESEGAASDQIEVPFGIRSIRFDADRGFFVNGEPVKLQGTCNHQDHAGVGAALPDRLQSYRIERLQAMGCNAYRTSHNPPTPELLDACDRLGMLVMDETRMMASTPEGLSQLERLIRRDRNHPAVILWSLGNEEPQQGTPIGAQVVAAMKRLAQQLDPTRPVTVAMNGGWGQGVSAVVDVQGFNYGDGGGVAQNAPHLDAFHRAFPRQPTVGTETASTVSTRGIYFNDPARGYVSAYDVNYPSYALSAGVVEDLRGASVPGGRVRLDRLRLPGRAQPLRLALHQLALWHFGHLRVPQGQFLLLPGVVDEAAGAAPVSPLELGRQGGAGDSGVVPHQPGGGRAVSQRPEPGAAKGGTPWARRLAGGVRARRHRGAGRGAGRGGAARPARDHRAGGQAGVAPRPHRAARRRRGLGGGGGRGAGRGRARGADGGEPGALHPQRAGPHPGGGQRRPEQPRARPRHPAQRLQRVVHGAGADAAAGGGGGAARRCGRAGGGGGGT